MDDAWTLTELVAFAAEALHDFAPPNGQVRAIPDERALRYYTTLGLLDRPSAMRGRTALYGRRHLAQVVAIKRLQAAGRSLAEIQAMLPTLDDAALAAMSGVPVPPARPSPGRAGFWREQPVEVAATDSPGAASAPEPALAGPLDDFVAQLALPLAPGVILTIDAARGATAADADAVRAAAAPLLAELARRRLVASGARTGNPDSQPTKEDEA